MSIAEEKNQQLRTGEIVPSALDYPEKRKREVLTVQKLRRASLDPKKIQQKLFAGHREPFIRALADFMECQPTMEAIMAFANKSPDRWAQAVTMLAKLAGYSEKIEIEENVNINVRTKSDAELIQELGSMLDLKEVGSGVFALLGGDKAQSQSPEASEIRTPVEPKQIEMFPELLVDAEMSGPPTQGEKEKVPTLSSGDSS